MRLETDRLIITEGNIKDYEKVFEDNSDKLKTIKDGYIIYLKDNTPVGHIKADRQDKLNNSIEISYNIHHDYWGNGYCPEATIKYMDYLYKNGYENIICSYYEFNSKSKRVIEKIGFTPYEIEDKLGIIKNIKCIMNKDDYYNIYKEKTK